MAQIEIILGPMFSGKSTELIRRCNNYEAIDKKVLIFNHSLDSRCENKVQTHNKTSKNAVKTNSLMLYKRYIDYDVIAIDEAQFFEDLLDFVKYVEKYNIVLIIAGLDGDCFRKPFGQILYCIPYANEVVKLHAMCMLSKDGTKAAFSKRIANNDEKQVVIGAEDKYVAVSRSKYLI